MAKRMFFITGTDTDAGKTLCTVGLLYKAAAEGKSTLGLKPVASGCEETAEGLRNADALALMEHSTVKYPYDMINPITFAEPIAPHIAARKEARSLNADRVSGFVRGTLMVSKAEFNLVEGAGGWRVPLYLGQTYSEVARQLKLPVILVVGVKLGCINHALLTVEAIMRDGVKLAGFIACQVDPHVAECDAIVDTLQRMIAAPCLGVVPWLEDANAANVANFLDLSALELG